MAEPETEPPFMIQRRAAAPSSGDPPPAPAAPRSFRTRALRGDPSGVRRTNDEIHSTILLDPVTAALLDTPPLQRLRGLRQLGTAELVYANCNHNRLEHSLGVAALAERLARHLQHRQPRLVGPRDALCLKLAGLFHDAGHGPFSHVFEEFLRERLPGHLERHPELQQCYGGANAAGEHVDQCRAWRHEAASLDMLDAALAHLGLAIDLDHLDAPLRQVRDGVDARSMRVFDGCDDDSDATGDAAAVLTSRDFVFVKEAINGAPIPAICRRVGRRENDYVGRPDRHQEWLYDVVHNRRCGLDVDKIDYFARDQRRAFREAGEIDKVMVEEAVVAWGDCAHRTGCDRCRHAVEHRGQHLMICYPEKMVGATMEFFRKRFDLHSRLYQHKTHVAVARMICDILCLADPFFRLAVPSADGAVAEVRPLSVAVHDPRGFVLLRDAVVDQIANTTDPALAPARRLIARLWARDLYKCVGTKTIDPRNPAHARLWAACSEADMVRQMLEIRGGGDGDGQSLHEDDLFVQKVSIHCGLQDRNPVSQMRFLARRQLPQLTRPPAELPTAAEADAAAYGAAMPRAFASHSIRVYCRDSGKAELAAHVFQQWLEEVRGEMEATGVGMEEDAPEVEEPGGGAGTPRFLTQDSDEEGVGEEDNRSRRRRESHASGSVYVTPMKRRHEEE